MFTVYNDTGATRLFVLRFVSTDPTRPDDPTGGPEGPDGPPAPPIQPVIVDGFEVSVSAHAG